MNRIVMACLAAIGSTVCLATAASAAAGAAPALFPALPPVELLQPNPPANRQGLVTADTGALPDSAGPIAVARGEAAEAAARQTASWAESAPQTVLAAVPDRLQSSRAKTRTHARALRPRIVLPAALPGDYTVPARTLRRVAERAAARGVLIIGLGS